MKESEKIIADLKKQGINIIKSPMGYYTKTTKHFENKLELVKEVQRMLLTNDYSVDCVFKIGQFMKKYMETPEEYFKRMKAEGKTTYSDFKNISKKTGFDISEFNTRLKKEIKYAKGRKNDE